MLYGGKTFLFGSIYILKVVCSSFPILKPESAEIILFIFIKLIYPPSPQFYDDLLYLINTHIYNTQFLIWTIGKHK